MIWSGLDVWNRMYALNVTGFQQEFVFVVSYQGFRSTVPSPWESVVSQTWSGPWLLCCLVKKGWDSGGEVLRVKENKEQQDLSLFLMSVSLFLGALLVIWCGGVGGQWGAYFTATTFCIWPGASFFQDHWERGRGEQPIFKKFSGHEHWSWLKRFSSSTNLSLLYTSDTVCKWHHFVQEHIMMVFEQWFTFFWQRRERSVGDEENKASRGGDGKESRDCIKGSKVSLAFYRL